MCMILRRDGQGGDRPGSGSRVRNGYALMSQVRDTYFEIQKPTDILRDEGPFSN
jgi:hypothetical protein